MSRRPTDAVERELWNVQDYEYMLPYVGESLLEMMGLLKQLAVLDIPERVTDTQLLAMDDLGQQFYECCQTLRAVLALPETETQQASLF